MDMRRELELDIEIYTYDLNLFASSLTSFLSKRPQRMDVMHVQSQNYNSHRMYETLKIRMN